MLRFRWSTYSVLSDRHAPFYALEIFDDRFGRVSTLVASQVPVGEWFQRFPDPTHSDAILDRVIHNAYRLNLEGDSQRKVRSVITMPSN
jgi:DNA replication protein DnaC